MEHTSTLGIRQHPVTEDRPVARLGLGRGRGHLVRIKIGHDATGIRQVNPEFDDVVRVAADTGWSEREVLDRARAVARDEGIVVGGVVPPGVITG